MVCPLLALRGWKQFEMDVLRHQETNEDRLRFLLLEGVLESFPQLAIGQVGHTNSETCCDICVCVFAVVHLESPGDRHLGLWSGPLTPSTCAHVRAACATTNPPIMFAAVFSVYVASYDFIHVVPRCNRRLEHLSLAWHSSLLRRRGARAYKSC